jgi:hypothetical protein
MSAAIFRLPTKPEPAEAPVQPKLTRADIAERARMLRGVAVEWGMSITVHGQLMPSD